MSGSLALFVAVAVLGFAYLLDAKILTPFLCTQTGRIVRSVGKISNDPITVQLAYSKPISFSFVAATPFELISDERIKAKRIPSRDKVEGGDEYRIQGKMLTTLPVREFYLFTNWSTSNSREILLEFESSEPVTVTDTSGWNREPLHGMYYIMALVLSFLASVKVRSSLE